MAELTGDPGFAPPKTEQMLSRRNAIAIELITTAALIVSLIVAATAVSMGEKLLVQSNVAAGPPSIQVPRPRQ